MYQKNLIDQTFNSINESDKIIYKTITSTTTYDNDFIKTYHLFKNCGYSCIADLYSIIEENFKINEINKFEIK